MDEDINGFVAGWFAGCAGLIVSHPWDTVRIRMQTHGDRYSSAVQCFKDIIKNEKMKGLFKGITYPLLGQAAINATVFGVQSMVYRRLRNDDSTNLSVKNSVIAGCCAGAVQCIITTPMELVKIRLQNQSIGKQYVSWTMRKMSANLSVAEDKAFRDYKGPLMTTREIIHKEGLRGMYKGWWLTIFREVPQFGIYFGTYAYTRLKFAELTGKHPDELGVIYLSLAGGLTGIATWIWYPVDVIKSRFQNDIERKNSGILDCIRKSVRSEGMKVFVNGLNPTLVRGFINGIATFPIFTFIKNFLNK